MRVLICGDRNYTDRNKIQKYMESTMVEGDVLIHGGATGADTIAGEIAEEMGLKVLVFPADWEAHGRAAGPIRNKQMLDEGKPDRVIAFHDDIRASKGTKNMVDQARKRNISTDIYSKKHVSKFKNNRGKCKLI